ncbi:unnamed protein product, partial [Linum tenue]
MKPGGFGDVPIGCVRRRCSNWKIKKRQLWSHSLGLKRPPKER